jgi:site-specific DNA-cytosine methylase
MKVLSLFDGIACGREALRRLGIDVERYVAYEIEPSAIKIAKKNFPDIEERGDVFKADYTEFKGFDLLIGGSPCFTKGHRITTMEGTKFIEDIKVGDYVLTHKMRYRRVVATGAKLAMVHELVAAEADDNSELAQTHFIVTSNHPFYAKDRVCGNNIGSPKWVDAGELIPHKHALIDQNFAEHNVLSNNRDYEWLDVVYNIEVEEDHTYVCNGFIVHNCTNWSIAKAGHGRETTNSGIGWELFSQYIRAWKESGVKYYLYENNASMSNEIREAISEAFGHAPLEINSALVSAQTRKRLYWTNIPKACIPQDMGIKLSDILEHGVVDRDKSLCLARRYAGFQGSLSYLCRRYFGKSMGQAAFELTGGTIQDLKDLYKSNDRFTDEEGKATGCVIRPLTETECERLQTLPDGYTDGAGCTRVQRIEAIGNGWTVNVIVHLMQGLLQVDYSRLEELADPKAEPGFVYSSHSMQTISTLTDEDCKQLSDICEVCGEPIVNIKNAIADSKERLHPIC